MPVPVMVFGGHRDGQILDVPGYLEPEAKTIRLVINPKFNPNIPLEVSLEASAMDKMVFDVPIVPRKANSGPAWKIDLPKELW